MQGEITIYTDGASSGNPGPGGYGVVLISGRHRLEISKGYRLTTNNRMELMAVIAWLFQWESKAFRKKKNSDLWIRFLKVYRKHNVRFVWIKGHSDNIENEKCDCLAVSASTGTNLIEDTGYTPENHDDKLF